MIDYKKKYLDALERANSFQEKYGGDYAGYIFPELRESEDERIRKFLVYYFASYKIDNVTTKLNGVRIDDILTYLEKQKEQKPIIQDVELNDAVYDYVRDHFIAGADFTPEYIKKLMENAFFAGVDYYLLKQESESCEPDTNVEKVIEDVIRVYGKTQGEWVGGYDVDTLIVNLRRAFNKKEQKPAEWSEEKEKAVDNYTDEIIKWEDAHKDWDREVIRATAYHFFNFQPKKEWSEEDDDMLNSCISSIEEAKENRYAYKETDGDTSYDHEIAWLESLRNRVGKESLQSWKPSEEQMKALLRVVDKARELHYSSNSGYDEYDVLRLLYKQLKEL